MKSVLNNIYLWIKAKKCKYNCTTALYRVEEWGMRSAERWKVNVLEMMFLRSLVGLSRIQRAVIKRESVSRENRRLLRWFGHMERMEEYCKVRRVLMADVSGGQVRGRPRLGCIDGVTVALGNRGMTVEAARQRAKYKKERRALQCICN